MKELIGFDIKDVKGVGACSLRKSRNIRKDFVVKYGEVPTSILKHNRSEVNKVIDLVLTEMGGGYQGFYTKKERKLKNKTVDGQVSKSFAIQGRTGVLSTFPQNVGRLMVEFYCPEDGIVYDPFAGHNSRMELVFRCNRHYVGVDISQKFMSANKKIKATLERERQTSLNIVNNNAQITLIEGSSNRVDLPSDYADFTLTSPPYWNIEYYGDEPEQLGNAKTYDNFLELLSKHVVENYRILKPGVFCCWFINDFRKNKVFYPYHMDLYRIFCNVGFIPFNIYIVDLGNPVNQAFVQDIIKTKLFSKRHEYILVFVKP